LVTETNKNEKFKLRKVHQYAALVDNVTGKHRKRSRTVGEAGGKSKNRNVHDK